MKQGNIITIHFIRRRRRRRSSSVYSPKGKVRLPRPRAGVGTWEESKRKKDDAGGILKERERERLVRQTETN